MNEWTTNELMEADGLLIHFKYEMTIDIKRRWLLTDKLSLCVRQISTVYMPQKINQQISQINGPSKRDRSIRNRQANVEIFQRTIIS